MSKTRKYKSDKIEICRNCLGVGKLKSLFKDTTCPVCEGSGRVIKTTEITITVEQFREEE